MIRGTVLKRTPSFIKKNLLTADQVEDIKEFCVRLLNVVLNKEPFVWFTVSDLVGKNNKDWNGTPLQAVYDAYERIDRATAYNKSAKDIGWVYLEILDGDTSNTYETGYKNKSRSKVRQYRKV